MLLAYKYVPPPEHMGPTEPEFGQWVLAGQVPDEDALGNLSDGEYAIYIPTKSTIGEGPEVVEELPTSFKFNRRVIVSTQVPKAKLEAA